MATVSCPNNVVQMTFVISGVKVVSGGQISGITPAEAQALIAGGSMWKGDQGNEWQGFRLENANLSSGNATILSPTLPVTNAQVITTLRMNGTGGNVDYPVTGVRLTAVDARDATPLVTQGFDLISG
jgi:hypothetical protein